MIKESEIEKFSSFVVEVSDDDVGTIFIRQTPDGNQLVQRVTQDEMDRLIMSVYESARTNNQPHRGVNLPEGRPPGYRVHRWPSLCDV